MPTDAQIELAARELCRLRGYAPISERMRKEIMNQLAQEILSAWQVREAIEAAMKVEG